MSLCKSKTSLLEKFIGFHVYVYMYTEHITMDCHFVLYVFVLLHGQTYRLFLHYGNMK